MHNQSVRILTWNEARKEVKKVNPELVAIIDDINPGSKYKLYCVKYPYGEMVFKEADLGILNISAEIKEDLSYRAMPLGIVLKNSLEIYADEEQRTVPFGVLSDGHMFGIWELFDSATSYFIKLAWNVSS